MQWTYTPTRCYDFIHWQICFVGQTSNHRENDKSCEEWRSAIETWNNDCVPAKHTQSQTPWYPIHGPKSSPVSPLCNKKKCTDRRFSFQNLKAPVSHFGVDVLGLCQNCENEQVNAELVTWTWEHCLWTCCSWPMWWWLPKLVPTNKRSGYMPRPKPGITEQERCCEVFGFHEGGENRLKLETSFLCKR